MSEVITKRMVVASVSPDGDPDFYFCKVKGTMDQFNFGMFEAHASHQASKEGYIPKLVYSECCRAGSSLVCLFNWETASVVDITPKL